MCNLCVIMERKRGISGSSDRSVAVGTTARGWGVRGFAQWVILFLIAVFPLAALAAPDTTQTASSDDKAVAETEVEQAQDMPESSVTATSAMVTIEPSVGRDGEDADADTQTVRNEMSPEKPTSAPDPATLQVYRSRKFDEYHWQPDCLLLGKGQPKALSLAAARKEGLLECGVCRRNAKKEEKQDRERPRIQYLGNRTPVDNSWRRPVEQHWRERVNYEWRMNSQTDAAWRDGTN